MWRVHRPFGLHVAAPKPPPELPPSCSECRERRATGWRLGGGQGDFYCVACWGHWDLRVRTQWAEQEVRWRRERGDFGWAVSGDGRAIQVDLPAGGVGGPSQRREMQGGWEAVRCRNLACTARREWLQSAARLRSSCGKVAEAAFEESHLALLKRARPVRTASDLAGSELAWRHDGRHTVGIVKLCSDGSVRWRGGEKQGFWRERGDGVTGVDIQFGARCLRSVFHRMRFEGGRRLLLESPQRYPPSVAVPQDRGAPLTSEQLQKVGAIEKQRCGGDTVGALIELQWLSEECSQSEEQLERWRDRLASYLREKDGTWGASVWSVTGWAVHLNEVNRDLRLRTKAETVCKRRLRLFREEFVLCRNAVGQTYVRNSDLTKDRTVPVPFRKRVGRLLLSFLAPLGGWSVASEEDLKHFRQARALVTDISKRIVANERALSRARRLRKCCDALRA